MTKYQQILMALSGALLLPVFWLPLWSIGIVAPQYSDGLGMFIGLRDIWGHTPHDLQNINILNHYIGMKAIVPADVDVLTIMPWVVGGLLVSAFLVAALRRRWLVGAWLVAFVVLGSAGMYEFWSWNYDYGTNLSPDAPLKVPGMTYIPPIIGTATLLTIEASSWPSWGTLMITLSFMAALAAFGVADTRIARRLSAAVARRRASGALVLLAGLAMAACGTPEASAAEADAEFPAGVPCAFCDGVTVDSRFGGEILTSDGEVLRFMSTECLAAYVNAGRMAERDMESIRVVDYSHGERLVDATTAFFVRAELTDSPNGLGLLATGEEGKAGNLHFFYGGDRLSWTEVLELVADEWGS